MTSVLQLSKQLTESPQVVDSEEFNVRTFTSADIEPWLELRHRSFAREKLGVREWDAAGFDAEFRHRWWWDPTKVWLAEAKSAKTHRLLGSVTLAMRGQPNDAKPVVHWLMVAPEARRHGLARALMSRLEQAAWTAGHREICLETHSAWYAAARFYESLGYQPMHPIG